MTQSQDSYKQTAFGKFSNEELLAFLENDPIGKEWLMALSNQIAVFMDRKQFGVESAKELICAAILRGHFNPMFNRS